jgi:hypothetical protein
MPSLALVSTAAVTLIDLVVLHQHFGCVAGAGAQFTQQSEAVPARGLAHHPTACSATALLSHTQPTWLTDVDC